MRRAVVLLATMALALLLASGAAQAIINGKPDPGPNAHPYVGAYVAKVKGKLLPVCSVTLISTRVFLAVNSETSGNEEMADYIKGVLMPFVGEEQGWVNNLFLLRCR